MYLFVCLFVWLQYTSSGKSLPKVEISDGMCAVCGVRIVQPSADGKGGEKTYRLSCGHLYPSIPPSLHPA